MRKLRRKSHDRCDDSPIAEMKRLNYSNSDDISTSDTAELSGDSPAQIERCFSPLSSSRNDKAEHSTSDEDDGGSSSNNIDTPMSNKPMHVENEKDNNVEYYNLQAPAPTEPREYITREECEEMIREFQDEIVRLNKLNSTLSANVAALYAENIAVEEELCHHHIDMPSLGKGQTEMAAVETINNGMTLAEEQYLNEIAKHRKSTKKLKKQLETQKRLVAKLSLHLKTSADKITALTEERDVWKNRAESSMEDTEEIVNKDQCSGIQKYQIQVIHNELASLQNLMEQNSQVHQRDRQQMLDEYHGEDSLWKFNLEEPIHTMERIIRSVTGNNGGVIDIPVEEHLEVKPVPILRNEEGNEDIAAFNVMDGVTSLFAKKQYERKQAKVKVDEHPISNEIKAFDVSRLKKNTDGAVKECPNRQEDEERAKKGNHWDDSLYKEAQAEIGESNNIVSEGHCYREMNQNDDEDNDDPFSGESDAGRLCSENIESTSNSDHISEVTATGAGVHERICSSSVPIKECNTVAIERDHEDDCDNESNGEESLYDNDEGNYVAKEGKGGSDRRGLDLVDKVKCIEMNPDPCQMRSDSMNTGDLHNEVKDVVIVLPGQTGSNYEADDGQPGISSSEYISNAPQSIIVDVEKEESPLLDDRETIKNDLPCNDKEKAATSCAYEQKELKRTSENDEEDVKSISYYQNVISQYISSEFNDSSLSKNQSNPNRLSRKQLFQREDLRCSDSFVDVVEDFFEERRVLIDSKNGRDSVPPYAAPTIPLETKKEAPHYKRGAKDGYYIYKSSSGNEYSGHWKSGRRHGYGMAKYRDGEIFHGNWRRGRRHGHGVLHLANQDVFDGDWATNQKHGLGIYYWADGEVDISWYEMDKRVESVRWTNDRRLAYYLDLKATKKEQISLNKAARIVKDWEKKAEVFDC